ncbi:Asp23/Gls24 family envelope stress response protein [Arthrobacter sp. H35-D1]|uniref:Asp23/Gls24 family envelope stress response protein n=1 Tax=Arthrobacter sp. H35-D1 TaxID=3046202 RepID=UPI0024BBA59A|nr:Asp23/Gls24 family envelope stress response protein [Arthrobacter sp. H35-D1]MDJ0315251.1 Asp23/Gls24 family envelope stress response protein [Arthrobacter sp. H35-D1]
MQQLKKATHALAESDQQDPQLKPRPGITNTIMDIARAEVRRGQKLLVRTTGYGTIEISEQALSTVIRRAATAIPGIHSRRCRIDILPGTNDSSKNTLTANPGTDPELIINLRVAASADINIPHTIAALRREIRNVLPAGIGIDAGTINITVEDLYDV